MRGCSPSPCPDAGKRANRWSELRSILVHRSPEANARRLAAIPGFDLTGRLPEITASTLLVYSEDDPAARPEIGRKPSGSIPCSATPGTWPAPPGSRTKPSACGCSLRIPSITTLFDRFAGCRSWKDPEILDAVRADPGIYFDSISQIHLLAWHRGRVALVALRPICSGHG